MEMSVVNTLLVDILGSTVFHGNSLVKGMGTYSPADASAHVSHGFS